MPESQVNNSEILKGKKIVLAHDFLTSWGGAEKTFRAIADLFPDAPIFTLLSDPDLVARRFPGREVHSSLLEKWPRFLKRRKKFLLPFFPTAVEAIDLRDFDVVISDSGAWMKGLVTRLSTVHIAYIHSPMRFVWDYNERYSDLSRPAFVPNFALRQVLSFLRVWDAQAAQRPECLIANSRYTQSRIWKYYRRESEVIFPPAVSDEALTFHRSDKPREERPFVVVSRLTKSKNVLPVVAAFSKLKHPLVVCGDGPEIEALRNAARGSSTIKFVGFLSDEKRDDLLRSARAAIFPSEDDFGIVAAESLAAGTPVIALWRGGVCEIVKDGETGLFFEEAQGDVIAEAVLRFTRDEDKFDPRVCAQSAARFGETRFKREFFSAVERCVEQFGK